MTDETEAAGGSGAAEREAIAVWAQRARPHLSSMLVAARRLEKEFAGGEPASGQGLEWADHLVRETDGVLAWMLADACPHPEAASELRAMLGVLRNAAFAFRSVSLSEPRRGNSQLLISCEALLGQGRQHLRSFEEMTGLFDI